MTEREAKKEIEHNVFCNTDNFEMTISKECYKTIINALEKQIARNTAEYEYVELDDEIKCPKISRLEAKAIKVALYHQWLKITDDNGNAISCSQEMADATYKMLCLFDKLIKDSDKDNEIKE